MRCKLLCQIPRGYDLSIYTLKILCFTQKIERLLKYVIEQFLIESIFSLVDPQGTDYCLTVNTKKNYKTLCSAQADKFGVMPPSVTGQAIVASQMATNWKPKDINPGKNKLYT